MNAIKSALSLAWTATKYSFMAGTAYVVYKVATADDPETSHEKLNRGSQEKIIAEIIAEINKQEAAKKAAKRALDPTKVTVGGPPLPSGISPGTPPTGQLK